VNYVIKKVEYQIVAGVNVRVSYEGIDNYTSITAVVNFDLKKNPSVQSFKVGCAYSSQPCTAQIAWEYFTSIETIVVLHP
jgi:hypothetical protein